MEQAPAGLDSLGKSSLGQGQGGWPHKLRGAAETVLVLMMVVMFITFIAQVVFRYVINLPLKWTDEVSVLMWLWGIFWGASFVMRNHEDMRFDLLYNFMPRPIRRLSTIVANLALVAILLISVPASWSYINFMKVEKSAALLIPMNLVFIIYMVFIFAMVVRHLGIVKDAFAGKLVEDANPILQPHQAS
jgi:TRAP-type C4-dicarboxylate transport system permease small subunit